MHNKERKEAKKKVKKNLSKPCSFEPIGRSHAT
jgi:hypothetical protein